jgi:uncharacterized protein DUF4157
MTPEKASDEEPAGPQPAEGSAHGIGDGASLEGLVRRGADGSIAGGRTADDRRHMLMAMQRSAGNAAVARLVRGLAPPEGSAEHASGGALLVADDGPAPAPGQMRLGEFLDQLKPIVTETAQSALTSTAFKVASCPWVEHWVEHYRTKTPGEVENAIARYAPEAAAAGTAQGYIDAICTHVRDGVVAWEETGEAPAAPADTPGDPPGVERPQPPVAFKLKEGVTPGQVDPRELQRRIGPGRPLDSSVRAAMGGAIGADFSGVRVHDDARAGTLVRSFDAKAFAVGGHVAFAPNEYAPGTPVGDALIAHELAHVVQQGAAPVTGGRAAVGRTVTVEADADAVAFAAIAALHGGQTGRRGLRPALSTGLQLSRCYPRVVPKEEFEPDSPFDQPKLEGEDPGPAPDRALPMDLDEAGDRLAIAEKVIDRLATRYAKDQPVSEAAGKARTSLTGVRSSLGTKPAEIATRISLGQTIIDRCETNLANLDAMLAKLVSVEEAERGRAGFLNAVGDTRRAYVAALAAAFSDGQVAAFNAAEKAGAGLPRAMTEVNLKEIEKPEGEEDNLSKFRQEVYAWVAWTRTELDKLQADADVVAKARRMKAPDLEDREKRFKQKAELMDLSLRGLAHYDRASRAERILEGFKISPGIQDDLVVLLKRTRFMYSAALSGNLETLRTRVEFHEADANVEAFYRAVPAFKFASDFAASLGIVLLAAIATAGVGGLVTAAIGETATVGGTLLAVGGTAAIEAFTFTLVSRGLQGNAPGSFLEDFAWNFGLFGVLKGVGRAAGAAAKAAELPQAVGSAGAMLVSFPLMHGYGVLRFRLTAGRWPTDEELDKMVAEEFMMLLGIAAGMKLLHRWFPAAGKPSELRRFHSEYGTKFEALEIARNKLTQDYVALVEKGKAADPAAIAELGKKAQLVEDTFKSIKEEFLKDKKVDVVALKAELKRANMNWIEGTAELLAGELGVPAEVGLKPVGGDSRSYTYHWGKTGDLTDGMRALKARVSSTSDPVSGRRTLTVTMRDGEPPLTFMERKSPYPARKEVEVDPGAPEITNLAKELGVTDAAATRELVRMVELEASRVPANELRSHVKAVRRAIKDFVKGPENAAKLDAQGYLNARATKGAVGFHAEPKLVTAAEALESAGILKSSKWLEHRDPGEYVGTVGEALAARAALSAATPGQTVLSNVRIVGDAFTDAALTKPATSKGKPIVGMDVVPELDLLTGEMSGTTFTYVEVSNVKAVQPKGSGEFLKQAQNQNAQALGALKAHQAGTAYQRPDGTYVVVKKVTAVDARTGAAIDLTGNVKSGAAVKEVTVGPAAKSTADKTAWTQRLPYTYAEIEKIAALLREMQAMKATDY